MGANTMPKRMNIKLYRTLLDSVIHRDGDICLLCHKTQFKPRERTLDHLDGSKQNNRLENLHLLCRACNSAEGNRARSRCRLLTAETLPGYLASAAKTLASGSLVTQGEREGEKAGRVTPLADSPSKVERNSTGNPFTHREESVSIPNSRLMDAYFRLWLFQHVGGQGGSTQEEAVNSGAEFLTRQIGHGSPKVTQRYFDKVISPEGWLEKRANSSGLSVWVFRKNIDFIALKSELEKRVLENGGTLTFKKSWLKTETAEE